MIWLGSIWGASGERNTPVQETAGRKVDGLARMARTRHKKRRLAPSSSQAPTLATACTSRPASFRPDGFFTGETGAEVTREQDEGIRRQIYSPAVALWGHHVAVLSFSPRHLPPQLAQRNVTRGAKALRSGKVRTDGRKVMAGGGGLCRSRKAARWLAGCSLAARNRDCTRFGSVGIRRTSNLVYHPALRHFRCRLSKKTKKSPLGAKRVA